WGFRWFERLEPHYSKPGQGNVKDGFFLGRPQGINGIDCHRAGSAQPSLAWPPKVEKLQVDLLTNWVTKWTQPLPRVQYSLALLVARRILLHTKRRIPHANRTWVCPRQQRRAGRTRPGP